MDAQEGALAGFGVSGRENLPVYEPPAWSWTASTKTKGSYHLSPIAIYLCAIIGVFHAFEGCLLLWASQAPASTRTTVLLIYAVQLPLAIGAFHSYPFNEPAPDPSLLEMPCAQRPAAPRPT